MIYLLYNQSKINVIYKIFQRDYLFLAVKMKLKVFQYKVRSHKNNHY